MDNEETYHEAAIVQRATCDTADHMVHRGRHRVSPVLDKAQAIFAARDQLSDRDYDVAVTRACAGWIVWVRTRRVNGNAEGKTTKEVDDDQEATPRDQRRDRGAD